jgi:prefoldin alpha subunit
MVEKGNLQEIKLTGQEVIGFLQTERQKLSDLRRRRVLLQNSLQEIAYSLESLKEMKEMKKNDNLMVSLGAGIYLNALVDESKKVKRNLPGNVVVELSAEDAIKKLEKERNELKKELEKTAQEEESTLINVSNLNRAIRMAEKGARKAK